LLLFLVGYEIDLQLLWGRLLKVTGLAYLVSCAIGLALALLLWFAGIIISPLLIGTALVATSLGVLLPVLRDAEEVNTDFGRLVVVAGSLAEVVPIVLLSIFFSVSAHTLGQRVGFITAFALLIGVFGLALLVVRTGRMTAILERFEDTSSQMPVRLALTMTIFFGVLAIRFGISGILGTFMAGLIFRALDNRDEAQLHRFRLKLDVIGYGFLVPVFFITTGVTYNIDTLFTEPALVRVPLFMAALALVRGLPAIMYRLKAFRLSLDTDQVVAASLFQATSLTFVVVATSLGLELHNLQPVNASALLAAAILSVIIFPQVGLLVLGRRAEANRLRQGSPGRSG
ncbi:MAG: cation:proton antiporter, partial [Acidimicrobiales bacterium]